MVKALSLFFGKIENRTGRKPIFWFRKRKLLTTMPLWTKGDNRKGVIMYEHLRPKGLDKKIFDKLIEAWKKGLSDKEALFYACPEMTISEDDLLEFYKEEPRLVLLREGLKGKLISKARAVVKDAIDNGNEKTARWYLEKKMPEEFGTKAQIEVQQPISVSIEDKRKEMEAFMEQFNEG